MALSNERQTLLYMLIAAYATFWMWYAPWPRNGLPLAEVETERFRKDFKDGFDEDVFAGDLEQFIEADDGCPFSLTAFVQYRDGDSVEYPSKLPEGFEKASTPQEAADIFVQGFLNIAVPYATTPFLVQDYIGHMYRGLREGEEEDSGHDELESWSKVYVIRFRTRRDFLSVIADMKQENLFLHKAAGIAKMTAVVSKASMTPFFSVDLAVEVVVAAVCVLLFHLSYFVFPGPPEEKKKKATKKKAGDKTTTPKASKTGTKNVSKKESKTGEKKD
eukprot:m.273659 g.273659  ORF g.273659 m.273659 type:complete len:275 (-) comp16282_c2_seq3:114-938(-)